MALFFDAPWFDGRLHARELNRADLAVVAEMDDAELALVFKDQMELSAGRWRLLPSCWGCRRRRSRSTPGYRPRFRPA